MSPALDVESGDMLAYNEPPLLGGDCFPPLPEAGLDRPPAMKQAPLVAGAPDPFEFCDSLFEEGDDVPCMADFLQREVFRMESLESGYDYEALDAYGSEEGDGMPAACFFDMGSLDEGAPSTSEPEPAASQQQPSTQRRQQEEVKPEAPMTAPPRVLSLPRRAAAAAVHTPKALLGRSQRVERPTAALQNQRHVQATGQPLKPGAWRGCLKSAYCDRENRHRGICNHKATLPAPSAFAGLGAEPGRRGGPGGAMRPCKRARVAPRVVSLLPGIREEMELSEEEEEDVVGEAPATRGAPRFSDSEASESESDDDDDADTQLDAGRVAGAAGARSSGDDGVHSSRQQPYASAAPGTSLAARCELAAWAAGAAPGAADDNSPQGSGCSGGATARGGGSCSERSDHSCQSPHVRAGSGAEFGGGVAAADAGGCSDSDTHGYHSAPPAPACVLPTPPAVPTPALQHPAPGLVGDRPESAQRALPIALPEGIAVAPVMVRSPPSRPSAAAGVAAAAAAAAAGIKRKAPTAGSPKAASSGGSAADKAARKRLPSAVQDFTAAVPPGAAVAPGTMCTACAKQETPVWRLGPKGPKTLCNACGVRWMKIAKRGR